MCKLVLASKSKARAAMFEQIGIKVELMPAQIDEREIEAQFSRELTNSGDKTPNAELALHLAKAKALSVCTPGQIAQDDFVIGADQILTFQHQILHKPTSLEELRKRWQLLAGKTHCLTSAAVIAQKKDNEAQIIWSGAQSSFLTMRQPSAAFMDAMIETHGTELLGSVGGYRIEDSTLQFFEKIEGDYFAVLGLPLLPLLDGLRAVGVIEG